MEEKKKDIVINLGDKVITSDGLVGRVIFVSERERFGFKDVGYQVNGRTETVERISYVDMQNGFADFYLIGKNFFGNKISEEEMERRIEGQKHLIRTEQAILKREQAKLDELRKQLWTIKERMVPDWKERLEQKKKGGDQ